jgi:glycosyltransferase involved in cell wall biosynthesis
MAHIPSTINIEWIHIGPGKDLMQLQEQSYALSKLKPNIAIEFKGFMDIKEVQAFLKNEVIDLHINVSAFEGIPVSIMEAMSCGIPCIATNVGGNAEIVNEKNGTLLTANPTKEEIADAITAFYNLSQEVRIDKSKQAKQTWELEYNAAINFEKFSKLLLEL